MDLDENIKEQKYFSDFKLDTTRKEFIRAEQPKADAIEILFDPKNPDPLGKNQAIMDQHDQASEPSNETLKLRNFKRRQMNEFTDNYLFSQVVPSRIVTVINVINTFLLAIILAIAFVMVLGLISGLRIGAVPSPSMKDVLSVGSMVVLEPLDSIDDIKIGDILSYSYGNSADDFIHMVKSIGGGVICMVGCNKDAPDNDIAKHYIEFSNVKGRMIFSIPYLGYVILFVKKYFVVVLAVLVSLILGLLLSRAIAEKKDNDRDFKEFLEKKTEYEREAARKEREEREKEAEIRFNNLMHE